MYTASDARLKSNISPIKGGLKAILTLEPKQYVYNKSGFDFMNLPQGEQFGFLADDVKKIFPNLTNRAFQPYDQAMSDANEGQGYEFTAVNYIGFIPVLVSAMKEQNQIIEEQKSEIQRLSQRLDELESLIRPEYSAKK
jgi:hypothetical protein